MDNQQPSVNSYIFNKKPKAGHGFIYKYTSPSGKSYIGQTKQSLWERAGGVTGKGYNKCRVFYSAIKKYGFENFTVEILEETVENLLNEKEIEWIVFCNTTTPNGYNLSTGGDGHSKTVYQYDCETGEFLAEYPSLMTAAQINGIDKIQNISDCLHHKIKASHGYIWTLEKIDRVDPVKWYGNDVRKVYAYNLDGTFFREFDSITAAARELNISSRSDIRKVLAGKSKFAKGYIWTEEKFDSVPPVITGKNGATPVVQIDLQTDDIIKIYGSQSEAARALGLSRSTGISNCCNGKQKSCAGFRWEFYKGSTTTYSENPQS